MSLKYNAALLKNLEDIFREGGYSVRYERGNFQNGYCVLEKRRVVVINKFHEMDAKINSMIEILVTVQDLELANLSSESTQLFQEIRSKKANTLFEK